MAAPDPRPDPEEEDGGPALALAAGTEIGGRFRLRRRLGRGLSGESWIADDLARSDRCVLKVAGDPGDARGSWVSLRAEARRLRGVVHPNLARFRAAVFEPETPMAAVATEFAPGPTVHDAAQRGERPPEEALGLLVGCCRGLSALHAADVVHRDLQPRNVVLVGPTPEPSAVVIDLGLAATRPATPRGALVGTLGFTAPEVVLDGRADARSDLYSLGAVLFYLLTGEPPVDPSRVLAAIVRGDDPFEEAARRAREVLPGHFGALAGRLLARHPRARFQDAGEVIAAVNAAFRTRHSVETAEARRPAVSRPAFVGRTAEVRRTVRHLSSHLDAGAAVLVRGAAGSGRTRFLEEVVRPLAFRGVRVAEIRPRGPDEPPLAPVLEGLRGVRHRLPPDARSLLDRARDLLGTGAADGARPAVQAALLLREALADACAAAPLVLCADDLDRLDAFSLDFVRRCAEGAGTGAPGPSLLVALRETEGPAPVARRLAARALAEHPRALSVALGPLVRRATDSLVRGLLPLPDLSGPLLDGVWALSAGSPRAAVEVVEALLEGALVHRPGGWTLAVRSRDLPLPPSLRDAAKSRLAALAPSQRDALLALALLGAPAERGTWSAIRRAAALDGDGEDDLRRRGLLTRDERSGTDALPSEALRRHLLEDCPRARLRRWCGTLADLVPPSTALSVRLRLDAGQGDAALREGEGALCALRHGRRLDEGLALAERLLKEAQRRPRSDAAGVVDEAAQLAVAAARPDRALEIVEKALRRVSPDAGRRRLLVRRCEVRAFAGEDPSDAIAAAEAVGLDADETARVRFAEAKYRAQRGVWEEAHALIEEALRLQGVSAETEGRLLNAMSGIHSHFGRLEESERFARQASERFVRCGLDAQVFVVALNQVHREVRRGRCRRALPMVRAASQRLGPHVSAGEECELLFAEISALEGVGRWVRARERASRAVSLAEELGRAEYESNSLRRLGRAEAAVGSFEGGLRLLTRSLRVARRHSLSGDEAATKRALARLHLERGEPEAALRCLQGIEAADPAVRTVRLLCAVGKLPAEGALAAVRELLEDPETAAWPEERAALRREEAVLLRRSGRPRDAVAVLERIAREAQRAGAADEHARALLALLAAGGPGAAWARRKLLRLAPRLEHLVLRAEAHEALARAETDPRARERLRREAVELYGRASLPERARAAEQEAAVASSISVRGLGARKLEWVLDNTQRINAAADPGTVLESLMDAALALTGAERGFLVLANEAGYEVRLSRSVAPEETADSQASLSASLVRAALQDGRSITTTNAAEDPRFAAFFSVREMQLRSVLVVPIRRGDRAIGAFYLDNRLVEGAFRDEDRLALEMLAEQAALAFENLSFRSRIEDLNARLKERLSLRERQLDEMKSSVHALGRETKYAYKGILRQGGPMEGTLRLVDRAVESGIPVLVQGESGTGKELVAKAIHLYGPRAARPFVVVNCAALPASLIESELFGHRRGAFTGAHADRVGQFETADGGTLFLDEVGELPLPLQPKLLRAVQFGEFVPLGASTQHRADVRLVCATNRDLRRMVEKGEFREDLYYRLAVFLIRIPPLRERKQDIPMLAEFLVRQVAREMGRGPRRLHRRAVSRLLEHDWPGNVRELENTLRRAVLVAPGNIIRREDLPIEPLARGALGEALDRIARGVPGGLSPRERTAVLRILDQGGISMREYLAATGISRSTALRDLGRLLREKVIQRRGMTTAAAYGLDPRWEGEARLTQD